MKTGVLFDLDGVLIDSESIYTEFWEDVDKVFPTNVPDFAHIIKGSTLPKILGTYFPMQKYPAANTGYDLLLRKGYALYSFYRSHEVCRRT